MKKKVKADSVEELFDIVRAVEKGEDLDDYADDFAKRQAGRNEADAEDSSDSAEARPSKTASAGEVRPESRTRFEESDEEFDEEFERLLDEDESDEQLSRTAEKLVSGFRRAGRSLRHTVSGAGKKRVKEEDEEAAEEPEQPKETASVKAEGKTKRHYGKEVSEEAESVGQRILHSLHMDADDRHSAEETQTDPESMRILDRILDAAAVSPDADDETDASEGADSGQEPLRERLAETEKNQGRRHFDRVRNFFSKLREKGIGRHEWALIVAGAVVIVLLGVLIGQSILNSARTQQKQLYVTADQGLSVTVENQPKEWCSSCELELQFSVKNGSANEVEINGVSYVPDENGRVRLVAEDSLLDAVVATDSGTLAATIEIPMLDAQRPVLTAEKSENEIVLSASDSKSDVAGIMYALVYPDELVQLPQYQEYREPIPYKEDALYYFYAYDNAGNTSLPLETTMQTAEKISLSEESITLFPGETLTLEASVIPEGALVNDLTYESTNTDVITVSGNGLVTAVGEGGAKIRVTADNLDMVTCSVNVVSEQTVTISAVGDCTLGTDESFDSSTNFDAFDAVNGDAYFFENVRGILQDDDVTFANFEGTLTTATEPEEKEYAFKGDPSYTAILQDGSIEVVTLANNHSGDYGAQGLRDTEQYLEEAEINYCIGDSIAYEDISGVKAAFIGIDELNDGMGREDQVRDTIAAAKSEGARLIIVAFHWGTESVEYPDETQQALAHIAVDCGADLVVGHHPHVLQGIEKYNGKYIVYSLGNFCFGGNSSPSDPDTIIFRQTFTIGENGTEDDDNIEIIPCRISSAEGYNNFQPTPVYGAEANAIMERINEYSAPFGSIRYSATTYDVSELESGETESEEE